MNIEPRQPRPDTEHRDTNESQVSSPPSACDGTTAEEWTLRQCQLVVDDWIQKLGVRYFSELTNLAQLMEEVGEVARVISRSYGEQSYKESDVPGQLADELADVLFVVICLANQTGIDLQAALRANLEKKTKRDSQRHHQNEKLKDKPSSPCN